MGGCCSLCRFLARLGVVLLPLVVRGLVRWCAAATGTGGPRLRLEVAGAFLEHWSIGHVPCDVQARFGW